MAEKKYIIYWVGVKVKLKEGQTGFWYNPYE